MDKLSMPGFFIVETKVFSLMAYPINALRIEHPLHWENTRRRHMLSLQIGGVQGITRQDMFYIGKHQLLMLLFMMQANHHDRRKFCKLSLIYLIKQVKHSLVNIPAVQVYLLNSRSRNQTSRWPIISLAKRIVIGIKKVRIL